MNLNKIKIENFKGIKTFETGFREKITTIKGANGTGKTSLYDAFLWCLFGKDSTDRKDFSIKPLTKDGEPIHKVTTSVELDIDGTMFRKEFAEKWTRKRGSATEEMTGHETKCFVNDIPLSVSEYNKAVLELCSEETFKMLTNPKIFVNLKKEVKRAKLFELAGGEPEVSGFDDIIELLKNKSEEALISECKAKIKRCKDNVATIPARIDEIERSKPNALDWDAIEAKIAELNGVVSDIDKQIADKVEAYNALLKNRDVIGMKLLNLSNEILAIKASVETDMMADSMTAKKEIGLYNQNLSYLKSCIENNKGLMRSLEDQISRLAKQKDALIAEYRQIKNRSFIAIEEDFCPTCGQALPQGDIEKKNADLKARFDAETQRLIDENVARGKVIAGNIEKTTSERNKLVEQNKELEKKLSDLQKNTPKAVVEPTVEEIEKAVENREDYKQLKAQMNELQSQMKEVAPADTQELKTRRDEVLSELSLQKERLYVRQYIEQSNERIKELENMLAADNATIAEYEGALFRIAEYRKTKTQLIEDEINNMFMVVTWKLFDTQLNGGEIEVCEPLVDGVPYWDVNKAMKLNAALDIIDTLSTFEGVRCPIFIDNRESVSEIISIDTQIINLVVDPTAETLTVC